MTVGYEANFLSPAKGEKVVAMDKAVPSGNRLTVCAGEVRACGYGDRKRVAVMQATTMALKGGLDYLHA